MTLQELNDKYKKVINGLEWPDKGSIHSYYPVYEEILAPYRTTAKNILEIGLMSGESLRVWEEYFTGKVYGIDVSEMPHEGLADLRPMIKEGGHNIIICDATSEKDIEANFKDIKWDVVFDDGSHQASDQLKTFEIFKSRMNKGGIIIVEDIENVDRDGHLFRSLSGDFTGEIIDRRSVKKRFDDALFVARF